MKKGPILGIAALVVLVAAGAAIYTLLQNLDSIVAGAIQKYGSQTLGTSVRVGSVRIELTEGRATIRGLRVANPSGYSSGDAFSLGEISVQIDAGSVGDSPIVVPEVRIVAPQVRYEMAANAKSNIDVILANTRSSGGGAEGSGGGGSGGEPPRIAIGRFVFEQRRVEADFEALGGKQLETELPPVRLSKIGGSRGATPDEIGKQVATAFLGSVAKTVAREQGAALIEKELGGEAGEAAKGLLKNVFD